MTSFDESKIARDTDGKFAPNQSGESSLAVLDDPSLTPVSERIGEEIDPTEFDSGEYPGEYSVATLHRDADGNLIGSVTLTEKIGPFGDAEITETLAQDYANDESDSRGGRVKRLPDGGFEVTRHVSARLDENEGIIQLNSALDGEGFDVTHEPSDAFNEWADRNSRWGETEQAPAVAEPADPEAPASLDDVLGDEDKMTISADEAGHRDITHPIHVERTASGFRASTVMPGSAEGPWVADLHRESTVTARDYADFIHATYGAHVDADKVERTPEGGYYAEPTFTSNMRPNASTDEVVNAVRSEKAITYARDVDQDALGPQFYAWKVTLDDAERDARRSWEGHGRRAPFPAEAFRASAIGDPEKARQSAMMWEASRDDEGNRVG